MENKAEETTPQNPVVEEAPKATEEVKPEAKAEEAKPEDSISKEELKNLRVLAEHGEQNLVRAKKAEAKVEELKAQPDLQDNEVLSEVDDEELETVKSEVADLKAQLQKAEVVERHPEMKDAWDKFEEFRADPENKGMNMKTAAKAFRIENGLAEPVRQGLEKQTGGDRVPISQGMSIDEVRKLRENDSRKYLDMVKKGLIKF